MALMMSPGVLTAHITSSKWLMFFVVLPTMIASGTKLIAAQMVQMVCSLSAPMPLRTMTGWVEKETRGMVYMHLHGVGEPVIRCLRCGKTLSNPISRHYGIGPECMSKLGIVADIEDVDTIKKQLVDVTWEGWIIKSAITEEEDV